MKIIYIILGILIMSVLPVMALDAPTDVLALASLEQPTPPSTETTDACTALEIKDRYCEGDVKHYLQCIQSVGGNFWQPKSENCKADFTENVCQNGLCMKPSEAQTVKDQTLMYVLIGGIVLLFFFLIVRGK